MRATSKRKMRLDALTLTGFPQYPQMISAGLQVHTAEAQR
jgi:hypothetical protein